MTIVLQILMFIMTLLILIALSISFGSAVITIGEYLDKIRKIKYEQGIVFNPLRLGFLVFNSVSSHRRSKEIGILELLVHIPGPFIIQFFVSTKEKKERLSKRLYRKLYNKYVKE